MRFQEGYAANQRYRQSVNDLKEAYRAGLIPSLEVYKQKLRELRAAQNQAVGNIRGGGGLGVAIQQVGYQVGDFAVQVQSGTNAFVAFGQQATQLVGVLPLVHRQLGLTVMQAIGLSTTLGIVIPIVTAFGAAWSRSRQQAEEAKKVLDPLEERLKSIDNVIANWKFDKQAQILKLDPDVYALETSLDRAEDALESARKKVLELYKPPEGAETSFLSEGFWSGGGKAQAAATLGGTGAAFSLITATTEEEKAAIEAYYAALLKLANLKQKISSEARAAYLEEKSQLQSSMELEIAKVRYGEESLKVKELVAKQARVAYQEELKSKKLTELQIADLLKLYDQRQAELNLAEEAAKKYKGMLDTLEKMAGVDISGTFYKAASAVDTMNARLDNTLSKIGGILAAIGSIGFDTIAIEAETRALKAGKSAAQANIEGQLARDRAGLEQGGALDPIALGWLATKRKALEDRAAAEASRQVELDKLRGSKGGSGSKKEQEDYLASLLKEAEYKKSIIGLSEEEARRKEIIFELTEKGLPIEDARIKKVLEAEEALRRATEAEDKRKNMIDNISNKMEEAFMSMIDGSKSVGDAFKGMIREILIDIYRQQVVNPMVKGIMGLLGGIGGLGGAPTSSIRPKPRPFANGGVVSRATMFPMANGSTGLMGEAGPEAIMPLKRGKDGKLGVQMNGGSGTVVVNQSFNFSANGDESVKKIIAQAAPQIAMMTQQQIMDSRRRGGSMKATFG
jgi:phage-related minor tail protein